MTLMTEREHIQRRPGRQLPPTPMPGPPGITARAVSDGVFGPATLFRATATQATHVIMPGSFWTGDPTIRRCSAAMSA